LKNSWQYPQVTGLFAPNYVYRYRWKKNGAWLDIQATGGNIIMHPNVGTISIMKPSGGDDGVYQCFVTNAFGTAITSKTQLKVAGNAIFSNA
jgi:hypothetical protein